MFFFFNDTATTEIYTLSLHDALPIYVVITVGQENFNAGQGSFRVARRNATNLADIWSALFTLEDTAVLQIRIVLALSERIRVIWGPTVATGTVQANIWIALS